MSIMRALEVGENMALQRQTDRESDYITSSPSRACKNDLGIFGDGAAISSTGKMPMVLIAG